MNRYILYLVVSTMLPQTGLVFGQAFDLDPFLQDMQRVESYMKDGTGLPDFEAAPVYYSSGSGQRLESLSLAYPESNSLPEYKLPNRIDESGNPTGIEIVKTSLRTYKASPPAAQAFIDKYRLPVGPTIVAYPGDVVRFILKNSLPVEAHQNVNHNVPHAFNRTNYHFHGGHVSPVGNSDNVLLELDPGAQHLVELAIPNNHITGTFWYHAHVHGATAMQVSSGVAGALIVKPRPTADAASTPQPTHHLDQLLLAKGLKPENDHIFLFQQIPLLSLAGVSTEKVHGVEDYNELFAPGRWAIGKARDGWRTTINGQYLPVVKVKANTLQRFRMIHGGIREAIIFEILSPSATTKLQSVARKAKTRSLTQRAVGLSSLTEDEINAIPSATQGFLEVAVDGIPIHDPYQREEWRRVQTPNKVKLNPGYRSDILLRFNYNKDGNNTYFISDGLAANNAALNQISAAASVSLKQRGAIAITERLDFESEDQLSAPYFKSPTIMAVIQVEPSDQEVLPEWPSREEFAHLQQPLPTPPVDSQAEGVQDVTFNVNITPDIDGINNVPYNPKDLPLPLKLGRIDKWNIAKNHPFHIHVNPFYDSEEKIWRDTLRIDTSEPLRPLYTRYDDYIGAFVFHCHILNHEDQGMMRGVEVINTASDPGTAVNAAHSSSAVSMWTLPDQSLTPVSLQGEIDREPTKPIILVFLESLDCEQCSVQIQEYEKLKSEIESIAKVIFVIPGVPKKNTVTFTTVFDSTYAQYAAYKCSAVFGAGSNSEGILNLSPLHGTYLIKKVGAEYKINWRAYGKTPYLDLQNIIRLIKRNP